MTGVVAVLSGSARKAITVQASPGFVSGVGVTNTTTASVLAFGIPPYSYEWVYLTGNPDVTPTAPLSATTAFSGVPDSASYVCVVTDSTGNSGTSNAVTANVS